MFSLILTSSYYPLETLACFMFSLIVSAVICAHDLITFYFSSQRSLFLDHFLSSPNCDCQYLCWPNVSLQFQLKISLHLQNSPKPCFSLFLWPSNQLFSYLPLLFPSSSPLSCPLFWLEHISSCLQLWAFLPKVNTALCYLSISLSVILSMPLVFVLAVQT